jgi:hypothetical protein
MLNNRELAILIWLGVGVLLVLTKKSFRSSIGQVLRAGAHPKILIPLIAMLGYALLEIWLGSKLALWNGSLTKDTVVWVVVSATALFFNFEHASEKQHFFRRRTAALLGITVFLEFFTNLFVLPLAGELALQPVVVTLGVLSAFAGTDDERQRPAKKFADGLLALIGAALLLFAVVELIRQWNTTDKYSLLLQFALPVWLTAGMLPYIYILNLYSNYEKAFAGINWATEDRRARRRAKVALISKMHFKLREVHSFTWASARRLTAALSVNAARQVVDDLRRERRDAAQAVVEEQERLRRYAGSDETDAEGRRLDRREFRETTDALRWLATCHLGWYRKEDRYRADLLERLGDDFTRNGLSAKSGITMKVSKNGQSWYAWRRTVTGWCFAIGAVGPPPEQWEYDGSEPPKGFPGRDPSWGDRSFSDQANRNWM